ncbi:MAG: hypothetical protein Tsb0013_15460 [Phycisphaerales bacterium]
MNTHDHDAIPNDLEDIAASLDALARADRDAAPPGLASRLAQAGKQAEPPSVIARITGSGRMRLAAAIAIGAVGVSAAALLLPPAGIAPAPSDVDIDALAQEGAETLRVAYASSVPKPSSQESSIWDLGTDPSEALATDNATFWDLGADVFESEIDWSSVEEVL